MNVCFLIDRLSPAGTETQLLAMIHRFDPSRVVPHLCLLRGEDEESRSLEPRECPVLRLGIGSLRHPSSAAKALQLGRFLRRHRIDVLQVHFPDSTYFGVPVARLAGVRRVVRTRRDLGYWVTPMDRRLGRLYNRMVDATLANCESCRQALIADEGPDPATVVVHENGVDLDRFANIPDAGRGDRRGGPRLVGLVANLRPVKDPEAFVRAAGLVAAAHPDVAFQIAGQGELRHALDRLGIELGLGDRLAFLGSVADVPALLAQLDVAVLCSRTEGLSNALLEYMAAGRPIVATAVGGNTELIVNEVHGLLVPAGDPARLAGAVARLIRDPGLAARLGAAARRRVRERHDFEVKARELEAFYRRLVGANGEPGGRP